MRFAFPIIVCLLLTPLAASAQPGRDAEFLQKFRLAQVYEAQGAYQNAVRLYEELYAAQPSDPNILDGYVRMLTALKKFSTVDSVLTDALTHASDQSFDLYLLLGKTRSLLGKKDAAIEAFHKAIEAGAQMDVYAVTVAVSNAMMEVGYDEQALKLLTDHRKSESEPRYTPHIANILFKIGHYADGAKEYLTMIRFAEPNPNVDQSLLYVEGRLSQFTADTTARQSIIKTVIAQIDSETATVPELRLLGWCYGELRDYNHSLDVTLMIDARRSRADNGLELYHFAEKALSEGAFDAASRAYGEVVKRVAKVSQPRTRPALYYEAELGVLRAKLAALSTRTPHDADAMRAVITEYASIGSADAPNEIAIEALTLAGDAALSKLHDAALAKPFYQEILKRSKSMIDATRNAYFALESIALAQADLDGARKQLENLSAALDLRARAEDVETRRHIAFEQARIFYFEGRFDTALATLKLVADVPTSDFANDAIGLQSLITENREGSSDGAMKVFAKAELLSLGSDLPTALAGYQSIRQTYPKAPIADEATLRAADLMITLGKANEAVALLEEMQEKMTDSPLLDRAALRQAEITEHELGAKDRALKLYEDFLARYPKSPLCTEVRQRARKLRGDVF